MAQHFTATTVFDSEGYGGFVEPENKDGVINALFSQFAGEHTAVCTQLLRQVEETVNLHLEEPGQYLNNMYFSAGFVPSSPYFKQGERVVFSVGLADDDEEYVDDEYPDNLLGDEWNIDDVIGENDVRQTWVITLGWTSSLTGAHDSFASWHFAEPDGWTGRWQDFGVARQWILRVFRIPDPAIAAENESFIGLAGQFPVLVQLRIADFLSSWDTQQSDATRWRRARVPHRAAQQYGQ